MKGGININIKKILIVLCIVLSMFLVSCTEEKEPVEGVESSLSETGNVENVKVTANQADIYSECDSDSNVKQTTTKNSTLKVLNKVEDWYAVKLPDNSIGFLPENQAQPVVVEEEENATPAPTQTPNTGQTNQPNTNTGTNNAPKNNTPGGGTAPNTNGNVDTAKDNNTNSLSQAEQEMLDLVNKARAQDNLAPLSADIELTNVARIKSQDMIDNNYFSHNSPTYGSPFDMMKNFGIKYVKAGENIAGNASVQNAHEKLMNSPGHRKNIMSPDYTHIGIGIKEGGQYGNMFTQMFISK